MALPQRGGPVDDRREVKLRASQLTPAPCPRTAQVACFICAVHLDANGRRIHAAILAGLHVQFAFVQILNIRIEVDRNDDVMRRRDVFGVDKRVTPHGRLRARLHDLDRIERANQDVRIGQLLASQV